MPAANPRRPATASATNERSPGVLVFAKAPVAGQCKTRLAVCSGHRRAARLYRAMLEHAVAEATKHAPGRVTLLCSPTIRSALFARLAKRYGAARKRQSRGDLGQRMHAAIRWGLRYRTAVVLIGSDQPTLDHHWYAHARAALGRSGGAWLAPTGDGGYWAIGLSRAAARVFHGPRWASPRVAGQTRQRLRRAGFAVSQYPIRSDIDRWRDWAGLAQKQRQALARVAAMPGLAASRKTV